MMIFAELASNQRADGNDKKVITPRSTRDRVVEMGTGMQAGLTQCNQGCEERTLAGCNCGSGCVTIGIEYSILLCIRLCDTKFLSRIYW